MRENTYPCTADRPELIAFFASLPEDPARDRLADQYRLMTAAYRQTWSRAGEITPRLDLIVDELVMATGKRREQLLAEHITLSTELNLLPRLRAQVARRYAEALAAWARYVRGQITQEQDRAATEVQRINDQIGPHGTFVERVGASTGLRETNQTQYDHARTEIARLQAERRPFAERERQAQQALAFIGIAISQHFGDDARRGSGPQASDVDRFVGRIAKVAA